MSIIFGAKHNKSKPLPQDDQLSMRFSVDDHPWKHPFLTYENIDRFRVYSEMVWDFAFKYQERNERPLKCAFIVNMAQNMYKWGCLAKKYGADTAVYPHPLDTSALSCPEWEEFDGEYEDIYNGSEFLKIAKDVALKIPCRRLPMEGEEFLQSSYRFESGDRREFLRLLAESPGLRYEALLKYNGFYPFYKWAKSLNQYDVVYGASIPFAAYASGRPYCVFSVGGDFSFDCGRGDEYGQAMSISFNSARFLLISNPHTLGHCRRLGFSNGVYLPYPMDDSRYCPGKGDARQVWEEKYGKGVYILTTARIDSKVKGYDLSLFEALLKLVKIDQSIRFIFLNWGDDATKFQERVTALELTKNFIVLPPVGKKKLIDYYRSCDIVLDHFVWGYYGATFLEAAAIGKPVLIKLRKEHYLPLYGGDAAPVERVDNYGDIIEILLDLANNPEKRILSGQKMRSWLKRTHGEQKTVPLLLALLRLTADNVPLPKNLVNPLLDDLSKSEIEYHDSCLKKPLS